MILQSNSRYQDDDGDNQEGLQDEDPSVTHGSINNAMVNNFINARPHEIVKSSSGIIPTAIEID